MSEDVSDWHAVRCCCNPHRIFGFIRLSADTAENTVVDHDGQRHPIRLAPLTERRRSPEEADATQAREMAIHSEHRPIEFWRQIRGFVEANSADGE
jgi:hypothetical protein